MSEENDNFDDLPAEPLTLPLDAWHRARGGRMVEFAGYWMPVQYVGAGGGIIAEHLWTREHAGLFDVSHMGQLAVSGPDNDMAAAAMALEALLPGDISALKPGRQRYSLLLDEDGGILDDLMITNRGTHFYLVVNGATKWDDIAHLREFLPDDVTINHLEDSALLALQGPEAFTALERVVTGDKPLADLTFMTGAAYKIAGVDAWISRSGYTGEDGFELSVPAESATMIADALCAQAEVKPIGLGARDSLRLEAGLPLYGHDLSPETDPVEADLSFAINKRRRGSGGFPGAERILGALSQGAPRRRVGLELDGRQAAREGASVVVGGQVVGTVTSGGFSPTLERPIAMAYIDSGAIGAREVAIEVRGKLLPARIVNLPFVPHRYHRKGAAK